MVLPNPFVPLASTIDGCPSRRVDDHRRQESWALILHAALYLIEGTKPNLKKIKEDVDRSLMLVTALAPVIGYDKASEIAHYAQEHDLSLKQAAFKLGFVTEEEFDRIVDPAEMVRPEVTKAS
jgi:aspartate ammonia-lyase